MREWLAAPDAPLPWLTFEAPWLRPLAQAHQAVPLYLGWTAVVFLREDGTAWVHDTEWEGVASPASPFLRRLALKRASHTCPALVPALPVRPYEAVTCATCKGTGVWRDPFLCDCAGYGWVIPGEERGRGIG